MTGYTYDTGALIAAERHHRETWAIHEATLRQNRLPVVPAVVLAQAWRGGPQPLLSRLLVGCRVEPLSEDQARLAGAACAEAGTSDVVDASVVVSAASRGDAVLTSDPDDVRLIADAISAPVTIVPL